MRSLRALSIPVVLLAITAGGACTGGQADDKRPTTRPTTPDSKTETQRPALPDTPAGRQLKWFLAELPKAPIDEAALKEHFAEEFLRQVPPVQLNQTLQGLQGLRVTELLDARRDHLLAAVEVGGQRLHLTLDVDARGEITGLLLKPEEKPVEEPKSWKELDTRLGKVAPRTGFLAAELRPDGTCRTVHGLDAAAPRPIGSMFKLYVLGAVKAAVDERRLTWDTKLEVDDATKSWPSGQLQDKPDGTQVTVRRAADLMISISDNTATDLLFDKVGRRAVEAQVRKSSRHVDRNIPMIDTRELFLLKGVEYPKYAKEYLAKDPEQRRRYLDTTLAAVDLPKTVASWAAPRDVETLEWFASPQDVCRAYAGLQKNKDIALAHALEINDGGLGLDKKHWRTTWFKGGSEPGVLALSYLAQDKDKRTYVVTALASGFDPKSDPTTEMLGLIKGAYGLVR